jgi:hypothetical protein
MSDAHQETTLERRVALPEPDVSNITVLTESLPNEPVLPWHHFDSPWLERDAAPEAEEETPPADDLEPETGEQLTLELEVPVEALADYSPELAAQELATKDVAAEDPAA